jgi:hypothetical protein
VLIAVMMAAATIVAFLPGWWPKEEAWLTELRRYAPPDDEWMPEDQLPLAYQVEYKFIWTDLVRRSTWGDEEIATIISYLEQFPPWSGAENDESDKSPDGFGRYWVWSAAVEALEARLQTGAPITLGARRRVIDWTVGHLSYPGNPEVRRDLALLLITARAIDDPAIRAKVEALKNDRDLLVAEVVALQLAYYDMKKKAKAHAGKE